MLDTVGVTLAGATEPAAESCSVGAAGRRPVRLCGAGCDRAPATPRWPTGRRPTRSTTTTCASCRWRIRARRWCAAALAAAEVAGATGRALLDAYVVGFELEGRLGRAMNPRHYQRGWHCTSTLGTIGAAAAAVAAARARCRSRGTRAGDCGVGGVRPQGEFRHDGEAAARGPGGAKRRRRGDARAGRHDGERRGNRRPARVSARCDGESEDRARPRPPTRRAVGRLSTPASR